MSIRFLIFLITLGTLLEGVAPAGEIDFNRDVQPILSDTCFQCHGPDAGQRDSELRLDLREGVFGDLGGYAAVVSGNPEESELVARIFAEDEEMRMPPAESNLSLDAQQKEILRRWISEGAEWAEHWAFIPPSVPPTPEVEQTHWPLNTIDRFVLSRMEHAGLSPSVEAGKELLIRRVTMDLTGLPPSMEEIDAFLADDSPTAYEQLVERLLKSDAHAERMAIDWMDLARFADSHGLHSDGARRMWPWRDWVLGALKANMPYDQFVTWQLAGDLLPDATSEQILATAFHRNSPMTAEGGVIDEEVRLNYVFDRAETTAIAFLGLTLQCAKCHDHKFDPLAQKDFYSMAAFFNNVRELGMGGDDGEFPPLLTLTDAEAEKSLADLDRRIVEAEEALEQIRNQVATDSIADSPVQADRLMESLPEGHRFPLDSAALVEIVIEKKEEESEEDSEEKKEIETSEESVAGEKNEAEAEDHVEAEAEPEKPEIKHVWHLDGDGSAIAEDVPEFVDGIDGKAMPISGEYGFLSLKGVGSIEANEPLSAAMWISPEPPPHENPDSESAKGKTHTLLCNTGDKNAFWRGWGFRLEDDNRLALRLIHLLPDDYLHVRTTVKVPRKRWSHVAFVYDGSGKASGVQLFIDGKQIETEILFDRLTRSIYPVNFEIGFSRNENKKIRVGKSYRKHTGETGIYHGLIDDIRIFDQALSPLEIAAVFDAYETSEDRATEATTAEQRIQHAMLRSSEDYSSTLERLRSLRGERLTLLGTLQQIMVMQEMPEPRDMYIFERGEYTKPGEVVEPGTPASVLEFPDDLPKNRLGLAQWIFRPENPLTARVAVNRYWQLVFGEGLIRTPEDLGVQGERPTHPELLDWLAVQFRESGWDVQDLLRQMVLSATYRQSSVVHAETLETDPQNRLLSRSPSYRLPAEMIRDNALAASGLLVRKLGGPSVKPYQPEGLWREKSNFSQYLMNYEPDTGEGLYRRSLYTFLRRTSPPPSMSVFDAPSRSVCTVKRETTNTPLQALVLLNDPQFIEAARVLAERVQHETSTSLDDQLALVFRRITSRRPRPEQLRVLRSMYDQQLQRFQEDAAAAESILSVGESSRDEKLDTAHTAALAIVSNTLMNYDEFYSKQ